MRWILSLAVVFSVNFVALGQATVVAPAALNGVEGSGFYIFNGPITFQQVYAASQLNGLAPGSIINGMQFRVDSIFNASPASSVTNFDVALGPSNFVPGSLTNNVANNQGAGTVQVRTGNLSFAENSFPSGGSPNDWGPVIPFSASYTYMGGDLLLTVSHTAPTSELDFDVGSNISGVQIYQAQLYNATTLTDSSLDTAIPVQFTFVAVPEPAFWYSSAIVLMVTGIFLYRRYQHRRLCEE